MAAAPAGPASAGPSLTLVSSSQWRDAYGQTTAEFVEPIFTLDNSAGVTVDEEWTFADGGPTAALTSGQTQSFDVLIDPSAPAYTRYTVLTQSSTPPSLPSPRPFSALRPGAATDIAVGANGGGVDHRHQSGWGRPRQLSLERQGLVCCPRRRCHGRCRPGRISLDHQLRPQDL
jgi:hypothetical protein